MGDAACQPPDYLHLLRLKELRLQPVDSLQVFRLYFQDRLFLLASVQQKSPRQGTHDQESRQAVYGPCLAVDGPRNVLEVNCNPDGPLLVIDFQRGISDEYLFIAECLSGGVVIIYARARFTFLDIAHYSFQGRPVDVLVFFLMHSHKVVADMIADGVGYYFSIIVHEPDLSVSSIFMLKKFLVYDIGFDKPSQRADQFFVLHRRHRDGHGIFVAAGPEYLADVGFQVFRDKPKSRLIRVVASDCPFFFRLSRYNDPIGIKRIKRADILFIYFIKDFYRVDFFLALKKYALNKARVLRGDMKLLRVFLKVIF